MTTQALPTRAPRYRTASLIVAVLMLGLPALLLTLDPGTGTELIDLGEAQAASEFVTYQAPAGWAVVDNQRTKTDLVRLYLHDLADDETVTAQRGYLTSTETP